MAHCFTLKHLQTGNKAYFFGYGNGFIYNAFNANHFNLINSGINDGFELTRDTAMKYLNKAIKAFDRLNYPDPERADELKLFADFVKSVDSRSTFYAHFS